MGTTRTATHGVPTPSPADATGAWRGRGASWSAGGWSRRLSAVVWQGAWAVLLIAVGTRGRAAAEGIPDSSWPASWFNPPQTASALHLTQFRQAPLLAARVAAGELPPLAGRLPDDPWVVEPAEGIGTYGGVLRVFHRDAPVVTGLENPLGMDPAVHGVLPNLVADWSYNTDGRQVTLRLRRGLRWSDGHPFTAEDWVFWHQHILLNRELTPVVQPRWQGAQVMAPDSLTVVFAFPQPFPYFAQELAHHGTVYFAPAHFLSQYHPDFVDRSALVARAEAEGFISWMAYFNAVRGESMADPAGTPTTNAFVLVRKSPTLQVYERNPYYPKVDPAGQQLPYIDQIQCLVVMNPEVVTAKTSTGQVGFSANGLNTADIPLFKHGEASGGFTTRIWNRLHGVDVVIQPNLTVEDPDKRALFRDVRFRRALSLSLDRDEMNTIIYFGQASPRQTTVIPSSAFYRAEFASAWVQHDAAEAGRLLDSLGLADRNADGVRELPDGRPLSLSLEWVDLETPKGITLELATSYWRAAGLDVRLKQVDGSLQATRAQANLIEMTIWHADRTSDILFPMEPFWFVPMHRGWEECHWTLWTDYYLTGGQRGEAPSPAGARLLAAWEEMTTSMDARRRLELGREILQSQADSLWTIGTLGLAPQPVVVSRALHNVPERGWWGWDNRWTLPYHPETWYLDTRPEGP